MGWGGGSGGGGSCDARSISIPLALETSEVPPTPHQPHARRADMAGTAAQDACSLGGMGGCTLEEHSPVQQRMLWAALRRSDLHELLFVSCGVQSEGVLG